MSREKINNPSIMKKPIILIAAFILISIGNVYSQLSLFGGYGMQGPNLRLNLDLDRELLPNFKTYVYGEVGVKGYKFDEPNFTFENTNYPSNTRLTFIGFGFEGSLESKSVFLSPYVGVRYIYARFVDKALFEAIGSNNLIRLMNGQQVGPKVENAYGNDITFDIGARFGIRLSEKLAIVVSSGVSPIEFLTTTTLFGKYWGEAPYNNSYYIEYPIYRVEAGLHYSF